MRAYMAVQPDVATVAGNAGSPDSEDEGRPADRKLILEKNSGCGNIPFRRRVGGEDASLLMDGGAARGRRGLTQRRVERTLTEARGLIEVSTFKVANVVPRTGDIIYLFTPHSITAARPQN